MRLQFQIVRGETFAERGPGRLRERRIRKCADEPGEQPVPVHGRMPIVAAIECRSKFARRPDVGVAVHDMADLVRVFLLDAGEGEACESFRRRRIKFRKRIRGRDHKR